MDKFQVSVLEYLGRLGQGVMALLSIVYEDDYYEATFFYTSTNIVLTAQEDLEKAIGHKITEDESYPDLIKAILRKVVPYSEMYNRLDEMDFRRWMVEAIENEEQNDNKEI